MLSNPILLSLILCVALNLFIFLFAFKFQTDKMTDITYAATFALVAIAFWYLYGDQTNQYRLVLMGMQVIWAIRLGAYLLVRVFKKGKDHRFDQWRNSFIRFGRFWLLQGVSIWIISLPTIAGLSAEDALVNKATSSILFPIGVCLWLAGFLLETIADAQKFKFRNDPKNDGQFMDEGLFSFVRFPNYLGEILVWVGVFIAVIPLLEGWNWLTIVGPIWITFLLTSLSGIPHLEKSNAKRYGEMESFQEYKKK